MYCFHSVARFVWSVGNELMISIRFFDDFESVFYLTFHRNEFSNSVSIAQITGNLLLIAWIIDLIDKWANKNQLPLQQQKKTNISRKIIKYSSNNKRNLITNESLMFNTCWIQCCLKKLFFDEKKNSVETLFLSWNLFISYSRAATLKATSFSTPWFKTKWIELKKRNV